MSCHLPEDKDILFEILGGQAGVRSLQEHLDSNIDKLYMGGLYKMIDIFFYSCGLKRHANFNSCKPSPLIVDI